MAQVRNYLGRPWALLPDAGDVGACREALPASEIRRPAQVATASREAQERASALAAPASNLEVGLVR